MRLHPKQRKTDAYLDGELDGRAADTLTLHCKQCEVCRTRLQERGAFFEAIRSSQSEERAPEALSQRIAVALRKEPATPKDVGGPIAAAFSVWRLPLRGPCVAASAAALLLVGVAVGFLAQRHIRAGSFVDMAAESHMRELRGSLPIDFKSTSSREMAEWFRSRLPFPLRLPTYKDDSQYKSDYEIVGGSLTSFEGYSTAYIAYRMHGDLISLLVTPSDHAIATGGDITTVKGINFHFVQKRNLNVFTWSVHHLTYGLVSDIKLPHNKPCTVCHADANDQKWLPSALTHHSFPPQHRVLGSVVDPKQRILTPSLLLPAEASAF